MKDCKETHFRFYNVMADPILLRFEALLPREEDLMALVMARQQKWSSFRCYEGSQDWIENTIEHDIWTALVVEDITTTARH